MSMRCCRVVEAQVLQANASVGAVQIKHFTVSGPFCEVAGHVGFYPSSVGFNRNEHERPARWRGARGHPPASHLRSSRSRNVEPVSVSRMSARPLSVHDQ